MPSVNEGKEHLQYSYIACGNSKCEKFFEKYFAVSYKVKPV